MNTKDQIKLLKAGYLILRKDDTPTIRIKVKKYNTNEWQTFEKDFKTKAMRDRRMQELLQSDTTLED